MLKESEQQSLHTPVVRHIALCHRNACCGYWVQLAQAAMSKRVTVFAYPCGGTHYVQTHACCGCLVQLAQVAMSIESEQQILHTPVVGHTALCHMNACCGYWVQVAQSVMSKETSNSLCIPLWWDTLCPNKCMLWVLGASGPGSDVKGKRATVFAHPCGGTQSTVS